MAGDQRWGWTRAEAEGLQEASELVIAGAAFIMGHEYDLREDQTDPLLPKRRLGASHGRKLGTLNVKLENVDPIYLFFMHESVDGRDLHLRRGQRR